MAMKPVKPTVPPAPSRLNPGVDFATRADAFVAFFATLAAYMDDTNAFVDGRADDALAAALGQDIPAIAGQALNFLRLNAAGTALEFRTPAALRGDINSAANAAPHTVVGNPSGTSGATSDINMATLMTMLGAMPALSNASGPGNGQPIFAAVGAVLTLPAGGTWGYWWFGQNTSTGIISFHGIGNAAGGSNVAGPASVQLIGFAWRIQ